LSAPVGGTDDDTNRLTSDNSEGGALVAWRLPVSAMRHDRNGPTSDNWRLPIHCAVTVGSSIPAVIRVTRSSAKMITAMSK